MNEQNPFFDVKARAGKGILFYLESYRGLRRTDTPNEGGKPTGKAMNSVWLAVLRVFFDG